MGPNERAAEEVVDELLKADWELAVTPAGGEIAAHAAAVSGFPRVLVRERGYGFCVAVLFPGEGGGGLV